MSQGKKIFSVTILLMGVTLFTKLISLVREILLAAQFGVSQQADIFVAVYTIPTIILTIASGAISAVLIPMIVNLRSQGEELRLKKLISSIFSLTALFMLLLTIALYFVIEPFVDVYVMGFSAEAKLYTIELFKIVIPALIAIGLISISSSILNAYHHFFTPSLGPVFYSLGIIIALLFFSEQYGVQSLIIGYAIGVVAQLIILLTVIIKKGISFNLRIWFNEDLKRFSLLILPFVISIGVFQLNTIVDKMMASTLPEGNLAALNYAFRITQLPLSIFVGAMVLPLFPVIAENIGNNNIAGAKKILAQSNRLLGILLLPVMGIYIVLARPIIAIVYQRGEFDFNALETTSLALIFYTFTILPFSMRDIITRVFYSLQDTWTPVVNSIFLVALNVTLMIIFVPKLGLIAVAGSTSISAIFGYLRIRSKLIKKIGPITNDSEKVIWRKIYRNVIIFTLIILGTYNAFLLIWSNPLGIELWIRTLLSLAIGVIVYIYLTLRLDTEEIKWLKTRLLKLIRRA
ncbi:MAG: murein biosynthesis integral membrane protein MurJ [Vulcanibacillus sp.]